MDSNPQIDLAHDFLASTGENIFLTGRAGTGKTTFLRELSQRSPKRMIIVAPTGVAAINAGGVTMHSFFQLPLGAFVPGLKREGDEIRRFSKIKIAIIKSIDLLVIDEISMVRADTLDNVDEVLRRYRDRRKPFGGVQLLMIGDLGQLSPVVKDPEWEILQWYYPSPYFFDSQALRKTSYTSIELQHIYRQRDEHFIDLLSRVRENRVDDELLGQLNERHIPNFDPPQSEGYITLTSHNSTARDINEAKLAALTTPEFKYNAIIEGDFSEHLYPTDVELRLKVGAQVMFTKNDQSNDKRYVNGTIGEVVKLGDDLIEVAPAAGGDVITVEPADWENTKYSIDTTSNMIVEQVDGIFRQYPLRTAWAITIHKSQGLTFDRAIVDAADSFSHGQVYVALSRCRTLEGMVLRTPMRREAIISDSKVNTFSRGVEQNQPTGETLSRFQRDYSRRLLQELFDFDLLPEMWNPAGIYMEEHLSNLYPNMIAQWKKAGGNLREAVIDVGVKFRRQIARLTGEGNIEDNEVLAERVRKGADYFLEHCGAVALLLTEAMGLQIDNKEVKRRLTDMLGKVERELRVKMATLTFVTTEPFTVQRYLETRGKVISEIEAGIKEKFQRRRRDGGGDSDSAEVDVADPVLFEKLRDWRYRTAMERKVPVYVVANQRVLIGLVNRCPTDKEALTAISGIGRSFVEKYGDKVLSLISDHLAGGDAGDPWEAGDTRIADNAVVVEDSSDAGEAGTAKAAPKKKKKKAKKTIEP
jgi:hypothetical protein